DARNISFLSDNTFDVTIMFGPCYHLIGDEEKLKAIAEAKRVTKKDGIIMIAYTMNEYSVLTYCLLENRLPNIKLKNGLSEDFHVQADEKELYDYVRIEDINRLNKLAGLERLVVFSPDGPSDYMRRELNAMDDETFSEYKKYVLSVSSRPDLIGAGSHVVDVLKNSD
ncbi:MAG: class I SAM-dependent methyltransferase, partial [Treponema sp.]|nr:class I SAM-dependent methyltransferase [Treponema sp.]